MRLFVAITFNEDVKKEIVKIQESIKGKFEGRLTKTENLHLTLKFLGGVDGVDFVKEKLKKVKFEPFEAQVDSMGRFGQRIIWLHVANVDELQSKVDEALGDKEERFMSHLTIARCNKIFDLPKEKYSIKFRVDNFKLIKSTLTPKGPVYEVLEEF